MKRASARSRQPNRQAIAVRLRALAGLLVVLLGSSSLAQVAHFLLVQHAICPEHGELVELHYGEPVAHEDDGADAHRSHTSAPADAEMEHDHCEVLARAEREQLLPLVPTCEVAAGACATEVASAPARARLSRVLSPLRLAPKTSPPSALA